MRGRPVARCARMARALAVGIAAAVLGASGARAQAPADKYPEKPIKIIVPFAPGGSVDILARVIGQKLTEHWRQPTIVETRPGAGTMIGTQAAAKADPDGYTLIIVVSNHATNPAMHATMPYDALKDFEPISLLARAPIVPYASPAFAPTNVKELVAVAKEKPGTVNFGSAGPGSMTHLVAEMLRYASIPNVPTFREQGFDLVASEWYGLLAPAGTPKPVVAKLNAEMRRIMALPNLGERLAAIELLSSSPEELSDFIRGEIDRWSPVIKKLGLKAE